MSYEAQEASLGSWSTCQRMAEEGELSSASGMAEACRQARNTAQVCSDGARAPGSWLV